MPNLVRHYGGKRDFRLTSYAQGNRLVGLAPMFIERVWLARSLSNSQSVWGADFALTLFTFPLVADYIEAAYRELIARLVDEENCDAVWFGLMPGNDLTLGGLRDACRSLQYRVIMMRDMPAGVHTQFRLPNTFEAYIAGLDKRRRSEYRRQLKLLNKNFKVESVVIRDSSSAQEAFTTFRSMHASQWAAEGKLGHFGDWPHSEAFNTDLVNELSRLGQLRIINLLADRRIISSQYAFVFGDCCYWRLPARIPDENWHRFGLGVIGFIQMVESLIAEGVRYIEAGIGHYDYKLQLGGEELELRTAIVASTRRGVVLRTHLFLALSNLFHLIYYKIWRLRLASRLSIQMRPLSCSWIRSNFGSFSFTQWLKPPKGGGPA